MAGIIITAQLRNVSLETTVNSLGDPCMIAWGDVYNDTRGRFPDGTHIHTSEIKSLKGNVLITRNSAYEVI